MNIFYIVIFITYILALLARILKDKNNKPNLTLTIIISVILIIVSGLRNGIGDTSAYVHSYNLIGPEYDFNNSGYEIGFVFFMSMLKKISENPQFFLIITSIIINLTNVLTIRYYSKDIYFELLIFLYSSTTYIGAMNGIRQSMVASLVFMCTMLIAKRKFKVYLLIMLLLSTFHVSVLFVIPLYFIAIQEPWSKKINILIFIFCVCMLFYDPVITLIFSLLGDSKYAGYKDFNEGGANILRIAVSFVPVFLSYIKRDYIKQNWIDGNIFVNLSLVNFLVMCISYYNWIFARISFYTQIYSGILLVYIISKSLKNKSEKRLLYYLYIVFYCVFSVHDLKVSGIIYTSNYTIIDFFYNII